MRLVVGPGFDLGSVHVRSVDRVALEQVSLPVLRLPPVSVIPPMLHTHLHLSYLTRRTNERSLGTFQRQCSFGSQRLLEGKVLSLSLLRVLLLLTCDNGTNQEVASSADYF
jgi:hypothetical protein